MMPSTITTSESLSPLIRVLLTDPACYDHPVENVQLVETHISWVVLTGLYAYKIKKPVNLGFLDFSTLALRQQDCIDELRLNRRLAADIYLDVVAITGSIDAPRINVSNGHGGIAGSLSPNSDETTSHSTESSENDDQDAGYLPQVGEREIVSLREVHVDEPIEYAVKMRQFPSDATMDHLAERGELGNMQIDALAARLAHFHLAECEKAPADSPWGEPDALARPVAENFQLLSSRLEDPLERRLLALLQSWCETEHSRLASLMRERKRQGWVRECHGDLHLANLAWVDGRLVIFDCLEFNSALRWIDVISEVAFCYMDLLHRKYAGLAQRFLNAWLEAAGDYKGVALLRYYAVYRALVRAKVAALRADQVADKTLLQSARAEITACLQLAEQLARPSSLSLWITHGLSGSGKTTLTQTLLEKRGMIRLRSDVERKRLAGLVALAHSGVGEGLYAQDFSRRTYEHLAQLAEGLLAAGWPVVVDAAFLERDRRDLFRDLAERLEVCFQILHIQADPDVLRERVGRRQAQGQDASEADLSVLQHQLATARPLDTDEIAVATPISGMDDLIKLV